MKAVAAYAALLFYGVLTLWIPERWAWSLFQVGMFALAGWRVVEARAIRVFPALLVLATAAIWPLAQVALRITVTSGVTGEAALDWFTFFIVFAVGCEILSDRTSREWFLHAITVFGMVLALTAVAQHYSSNGKVFWVFPSGFTDDVLGPFVNRNQYAAWVELLLPVALYRAWTMWGGLRGPQPAPWPAAGQGRPARTGGSAPLFALAAPAILFGSVVASASRAGVALVWLEVIVITAIMARRRIVVVIPIAVVTAVIGWCGLQARFATAGAETVRVEAARASFQMIHDRPWTGFGLGAWPVVYPRYASFDPGVFLNQAHNDWLQWAAEGGLPFMLLMVVFAVLVWKRAMPSIYGLGTVAFLLHALVDYPMQQRPVLAAWFFAMTAAAVKFG